MCLKAGSYHYHPGRGGLVGNEEYFLCIHGPMNSFYFQILLPYISLTEREKGLGKREIDFLLSFISEFHKFSSLLPVFFRSCQSVELASGDAFQFGSLPNPPF